jgi:hypothetical protein
MLDYCHLVDILFKVITRAVCTFAHLLSRAALEKHIGKALRRALAFSCKQLKLMLACQLFRHFFS